MKEQVKNLIRTSVYEAQTGKTGRKEIYSELNINGNNEFLFFIKPEITIKSDSIKLDRILDTIFVKLEEFKFQISNINILPAAYLEKHSIIAQHYGVINAIARNAKENLSAGAKNKFAEHFGVDINEVQMYGGIELIKAYPAFTPLAVDYIWQNSPAVKLGGGAYCSLLKFDGQPVYLVNGFHPRQLEHFIAPGRSILAFTLAGDVSWKVARNNFIGKTNPNDAEKGSIRRILLENKDLFGLTAVNSSWNGVHLSAGPVEGLIELMRYNSDFEAGNILPLTNFSFGKKLKEVFNEDSINGILSNKNISVAGKETNFFDLTEEKDSDEAIEIIKGVLS